MKNTGIVQVTSAMYDMWEPSIEQHLSADVYKGLSKQRKALLIGMANSKAEVLMSAAGIESFTPESMMNFFSMEGLTAASYTNSGMAPNVLNPVNGVNNGLVTSGGAKGSGDKQYLVGLCIAIAAKTIGLELVQSINATSNSITVDTLEMKYGGGDIEGAGNTDDYVFTITFNEVPVLEKGESYAFRVGSAFVTAKFVQQARDVVGGLIFELQNKFTATVTGTALSAISYISDVNYAKGLTGATLVKIANDLASFVIVTVDTTNVTLAGIAHTTAVENYVPHQTTNGLKRTLTRSEADAGSDRSMEVVLENESHTIGNRTFNGQISRLQYKRLEERGIDPMAYITGAMKNEISQEVNYSIISAARALGCTNALEFEQRGVTFNTLFAPTAVATKNFDTLLEAKQLTDIKNVPVASKFKPVKNVLNAMAFENIQSLGTAICMFIKQAAYAIGTNSRYGDADAVILPAGLAAYVSSSSDFTNLNDKNVAMDSKSGAKQIGTIGSIKVYVDVMQNEASPFVTVLRTNQDISMDIPGVMEDEPILMPGLAYLVKDLISSTDLVPESTGGRKIIIDSETELVLIGKRPAAGYLTFCIDIALPGLGIANS